MFTIREGRKEDCRQLVDMFAAMDAHLKSTADPDTKWTDDPNVCVQQLEEDGFCVEESQRRFRIFVAQSVADPQTLVGYVFYFPKYSRKGRGVWMESMYVKRECRGTGAGVALMAAVANRALTDGCQRFEWSCREYNHGSMAFYKKLEPIDVTHDDQDIVFRLNAPKMRQLAARADLS
ncbi:unnamed protein product [Medioppia subpectinata]|uniref:N-acetyltransferase domain-containing protein n=1 Tax=Medioppia subpectinata TaxID=1979941 RepID=A0A7R9KVL7_9ACAR|nr:unnamed protein product [Medioppia subpectinata]CAG2110686.1 unnamed protein product [Medioppia subpectinata]